MDWKRAKTILLLVFFILNIVLSVVLYQNFKVEEISEQTIKNTKRILEKNKVLIECPIPVSIGNDYSLQSEEKVLDKIRITTELLGEDYKENSDNSFINGTKSLVFTGSSGFEFQDTGSNELLKTYGKSDVDKYLRKLSKTLGLPFDEFKQDGYYQDLQTHEGARVAYKGVYQGYDIFDNYIDIEVSKSGIKNIKYNYKKPINLTLIKDINVIPAYQILITKMTNFPEVTIISVGIGFKGYTVADTKTLYESLSWRIMTSDGKEYFFNARNGEEME